MVIDSLVLLDGAAIGGGLFEHIVLDPLWSKSPPSSFAIIQPGTGVPLQNFWIPVHSAITIFVILSLIFAWRERKVRRLLFIGLASYIVMRAWSGLVFIREMLGFQKVPVDSAPTPELSARVSSWLFWSWFREPLDVTTFLSFLLALYWFKDPPKRTESLQLWLDKYVKAWRTYEPAQIGDLFCEDALYFPALGTKITQYADARRLWQTGARSPIRPDRGKRVMCRSP